MVTLEQRVRERAYFLWIDSGRIDGYAHEHWVAAETSIAFEQALSPEVARTAAIKKVRATTAAKPAAVKSKATLVKAKATADKTKKATAGATVQLSASAAKGATKVSRKSVGRSDMSMIGATTH